MKLMRIKCSVIFIGLIFTILIILMTSCNKYEMTSEEARIHNATVADILVNPDKYDGKMVQVEGWVSSLQFNASRAGPYTTFKLGNQPRKALYFVSLGILPIKEGDFVSVTSLYNKSDSLIWINSIEGPAMGRYK